MPLYEALGLTNLHTAFDVCFAVMPSEDEDAFRWVVQQQRALAEKHGIAPPGTVITDYCAALKNALDVIFPETQQMICTWHVTKNVRCYVKENWEGRGRVEDVMTVMQLYANTGENRARATHVLRDANKKSQDNLLELFYLLMHSDEEAEFLVAWEEMRTRFADQPSKFSITLYCFYSATIIFDASQLSSGI